jgi:hypothetical protein
VASFRTTTGQSGFALGLATIGAIINGFGVASLHERLLKLGSTPVQTPGLAAKGSPLKIIQMMADTYASGLAGAMLVVALLWVCSTRSASCCW